MGAYMLKPFRSSLQAGFQAYHDIKAYDMRFKILRDRGFNDSMSELSELMPGDVFLWISMTTLRRKVPWTMLRQRGVRTIYYQSEPIGYCSDLSGTVDEIWDYSWFNIDGCMRRGWKGLVPVLRYVPPAALETPVAFIGSRCGAPLLLGASKYRRQCWGDIQARFNNSISTVYNVWTNKAFAKLLGFGNVFLNYHKGCMVMGPVSCRIQHLLNAHALIISERCYTKDEAEFDGLVSFVERDRMHEEYLRLCSLTQAERQKLADARAASFAERFSPASIFRRAGVYAMLDELARTHPHGR